MSAVEINDGLYFHGVRVLMSPDYEFVDFDQQSTFWVIN
jgi:hypothetical protein